MAAAAVTLHFYPPSLAPATVAPVEFATIEASTPEGQAAVDQLKYERDVAKMQADLLKTQTVWFEVLTSSMIGLLGALITVTVIFFTLRFDREARLIAEKEAKEAALNAVGPRFAEMEKLFEQARGELTYIEVTRDKLDKAMATTEPGQEPKDEVDRETIRMMARKAERKRRSELSVDDFRALIVAARMEKSWSRMLSLAQAMEFNIEGAKEKDAIFPLFYRGVAHTMLGQFKAAYDAYHEVVERFAGSNEIELRRQVAKAMFNKGVMLDELDDPMRAIECYKQVIDTYREAKDPELAEQVAKASFNMGRALLQVRQWKNSVDVSNRLHEDFGTSGSLVILGQVAGGMVNKGYALTRLGDHKGAIDVYESVVGRFAHENDARLVEATDKALFNIACRYASMGKVTLAIDALRKWAERLKVFDCDKVRTDDDFDPIRQKPSFRKFLESQGCRCEP